MPFLKRFVKTHPYFSLFVAVITILQILPTGTYGLLNAATYKPVEGFKLSIPVLNYILEPFIGIPIYLSTDHYIRQEAIGLFVWGLLFVLLFNIVKKRYTRIITFTAGYLIAFSLFIVYLLFTPFPLLKVIPPKGYCLVDPHSHTFYSHDGIVTPVQNMLWHEKQGFSAWFVTEHYNINGGIAEQNLTMYTGVKSMIGEEIRANDDPHYFLALGITSSVAGWCPACPSTVKALADAVHKQGGALVLALWWLNNRIDLGHYIHDGVDAIEIANAGHKQALTSSIRRMAYQFAREYNVPLLASSDWHGWGNFAYTWTAFYIPGFTGYSLPQLQHKIISMIRNRQTNSIIPIIYDYPHQYWGTIRFVFAPFFDFYYYFSTLPLAAYISWLIWSFIFLSISVGYKRLHRQFFHDKPALLPYVCFIIPALMSLYYAIGMITRFTFIPVENTLLLTVIYVLLFYSIGVLMIIIIWLYYRGRLRKYT
ncbi:MAG: PHP domain-containing protein [bacterium]